MQIRKGDRWKNLFHTCRFVSQSVNSNSRRQVMEHSACEIYKFWWQRHCVHLFFNSVETFIIIYSSLFTLLCPCILFSQLSLLFMCYLGFFLANLGKINWDLFVLSLKKNALFVSQSVQLYYCVNVFVSPACCKGGVGCKLLPFVLQLRGWI